MSVKRETGATWYSRTLPRRQVSAAGKGILGDLPSPGSSSLSLIELQGDPGSGKTLFLTHFIADCLLPKTFLDAAIGGLEAGVLLIDTECDFSIATLATILATRVEKAFPSGQKKPFTANDLELLVISCLKRLTIRTVGSSEEATSLASKLRDALLRRPEVDVVVWDSISSFYWNRRSSREGSHGYYEFISKLLNNAGVPVIATVQVLFARKAADGADGDGENWQNYLGPGWRDHVAKSFMFKKIDDAEGGFQVCSKDGSVPEKVFKMDIFKLVEISDDSK